MALMVCLLMWHTIVSSTDVSEIPQWANGTHKGQSAGTDLTGKIEKAPYGVKNLDLVKK